MRTKYRYADVHEKRKQILKLKRNMQPDRRKEREERERRSSKKDEKKKN